LLRKIEEEENERLKLESDMAEMEKEEINIIQIFKAENISEQRLMAMFEIEFKKNNNRYKSSLDTHNTPYVKPKLSKKFTKTED
jgi:hypothetical protein